MFCHIFAKAEVNLIKLFWCKFTHSCKIDLLKLPKEENL
jgi:hypothetical protein